MMTGRTSRRVDSGALMRAPVVAMHWRLLLLWVLLLLLPTAVVSFPFWRALSGTIDHSVHVQAWANQFSASMFGDAMAAMKVSTWFNGVAILGMLLTVLMSPFLNGMVVGSGRAGRALGFSHLLQCGIVEYGRMFRVMLWAILPYAIMGGLAGLAMHMSGDIGDKSVLQSDADRASHLALFVVVVVFVLAQVVVESSRAAFIADTGLRSATRALGRGFMQLLRRPFSSVLSFVLISMIGYALAFAIGISRIHTPALGVAGLLLAFVLTQLVVLVIGWVRVARLLALAEVSRSIYGSRHGSGMPTAL